MQESPRVIIRVGTQPLIGPRGELTEQALSDEVGVNRIDGTSRTRLGGLAAPTVVTIGIQALLISKGVCERSPINNLFRHSVLSVILKAVLCVLQEHSVADRGRIERISQQVFVTIGLDDISQAMLKTFWVTRFVVAIVALLDIDPGGPRRHLNTHTHQVTRRAEAVRAIVVFVRHAADVAPAVRVDLAAVGHRGGEPHAVEFIFKLSRGSVAAHNRFTLNRLDPTRGRVGNHIGLLS
ncbi:hypothetical protein CA85_42780 [Allorhodopirellula solitaria]|uniref:Uncharacterized protein n=1 Tax=Allorhodopirellula solitaria TaxID=2527987 RepID=A0A5C5X2R2_9BACT|nr:hypothetical protein CA85_42780 [Allorhodopirellula solitaria]